MFYENQLENLSNRLRSDDKKTIEIPQRPSTSQKPSQKIISPPSKKEKSTKKDSKTDEPLSKKEGYDISKTEKKTDTTQTSNLDNKLPHTSTPTPSIEGSPQKPLKEPKTFREKFFDRDVIKELAKVEKPTPEKDGTITFDTREFKYHDYLKKLRERIESVWKYPQEAAERGIYGDLYIKFTINKNGSIGPIEIVRTSGHRLLDNAAMKAIKDAAPYWPVPEELGKDSFTITGHFVYSIYGTFIR